jgi:preprotein translocase subunit SecF
MLKIIQKKKLWFSISGVLVILSLFSFFTWGLNFGIDFTGGSLLEVKYKKDRPSIENVNKEVASVGLKDLIVLSAGEKNLVFRFQDTDPEKKEVLMTSLEKMLDEENSLEEVRYEAIGPSIGYELRKNTIYAIIIVLIAVALYVAYAFRKVSKPVASWKYGIASLIALFHDVIIVIGVFSFLGKFYGIEVNTTFVAALLTVSGYSINDTIVVFDRIRENLPKSYENFTNTVNMSINQTLVRSINTSMTVLIILAAIIILGGESIRYFALALFIGVFFGTYSSIFIASPLLVFWNERKNKN